MSKFTRFVDHLSQMRCGNVTEKHYALVFNGKKIISTAVNHLGSKIDGYDVPSIHAEMGAIHRAKRYRLRGKQCGLRAE